eukprot:447433-Amorphochlora_amoeboformis.AAC.1
MDSTCSQGQGIGFNWVNSRGSHLTPVVLLAPNPNPNFDPNLDFSNVGCCRSGESHSNTLT